MGRRSIAVPAFLARAALIAGAVATPFAATTNGVQRFGIGTEWRLLDRSPDGTMISGIDLGPTTVYTFAIPSGAEIACAKQNEAMPFTRNPGEAIVIGDGETAFLRTEPSSNPSTTSRKPSPACNAHSR